MWIKVCKLCTCLLSSFTVLSLLLFWTFYLLIIFGKCIQAKELEANSEYYIELLAKGTGKSKEEIAKDVQRTRYFQPQDAIEYGLADKIMHSMDGENAYKKRVRNIIDINLYFP